MSRTASMLVFCACIALTATADVKSWTGSVSNLWSVGGNWNGGVAPVSGDALVFPNGALNRMTNNDIVGLSLRSVSIAASTYRFSGNAVTLSDGMSTECCAAIAWNLPTTLAAPQTFSDRSQTAFGNTIDLNGHTLTMNTYITTLSGSIVGSGSVLVRGSGSLNLAGTSTFTGPLTVSSIAFQVAGTVTNSMLAVEGVQKMSGAGSVPETSLSNTTLSVGHDPGAGCCADPQSTGILSTDNLSIIGGTVRLDLVSPTAGTGSDQINTKGTVTLSNPTLQVELPRGLPAAGQSFVIINNDGVEAVKGTFSGLGEGAVFAVGPAQFRISYSGGSGNDVVVTAQSGGPKSWTGAVSNLWSVGGNWSGGIAPVNGDALLFPNGATNRATDNDILRLSLRSVSIAASTYRFSGNALNLSDGLETECCAAIAWNLPTTLAASQTFNDRSQTTFGSTIDLNGHTLTLNTYTTTLSGSIVGSGRVIVGGAGTLNLTGTSSFTGPFIVSPTAFQIAGTITNSILTVGNRVQQVSGAGSAPETSLSNTILSVGHDPGAGCCADPQSTGILSTGNLSITGGTVRLDLVSPSAGSGYDQINTTGTITLSNPTLQVVLPRGVPAAGQSFVIMNNDGTEAVKGTFSGLAERAVFAVGVTRFRISYAGGSGNDVVLTALAPHRSR